MDSISEFKSLALPKAQVMPYQKDFILWEKLTALHQFSTQEKEPKPDRLARHWYYVDCLFNMNFSDPLNSDDAMRAVIKMKKHRWASPGVDYELILQGGLILEPNRERLDSVSKDHQQAVSGGMFFTTPDTFNTIVGRLTAAQELINEHIKSLK